jgi:hypothetical protein
MVPVIKAFETARRQIRAGSWPADRACYRVTPCPLRDAPAEHACTSRLMSFPSVDPALTAPPNFTPSLSRAPEIRPAQERT